MQEACHKQWRQSGRATLRSPTATVSRQIRQTRSVDEHAVEARSSEEVVAAVASVRADDASLNRAVGGMGGTRGASLTIRRGVSRAPRRNRRRRRRRRKGPSPMTTVVVELMRSELHVCKE